MALDAVALALQLKDDEIARQRSMPYSEYLKTPWWSFVHDRAIKRAGGSCELCKRAGATEAHHTTYDRIGCEQPDDLVALCRDCHQHITDNALDRVERRKLLQHRREFLYSPEFARGWGRF